jgi:hypothetical protein
MKTLLLLFGAIAIGALYVFYLNDNETGTALAQEAATNYCSMVMVENTPNRGNTLSKDLETLTLKHAGFMKRGNALYGDEKADFKRTYSLMVSHCK